MSSASKRMIEWASTSFLILGYSGPQCTAVSFLFFFFHVENMRYFFLFCLRMKKIPYFFLVFYPRKSGFYGKKKAYILNRSSKFSFPESIYIFQIRVQNVFFLSIDDWRFSVTFPSYYVNVYRSTLFS